VNKYEMMFIVKATNEGAAVQGTAEEIKKIAETTKAKVIDLKDLGLKKLAYEIKGEINGYYYLLHFTANKEQVAEINRKTSLNENIIRHLIVKQEEE
jgi:small subunit ribosomal protein S6